MEAAQWLLVVFAAAAAGDDGVATFDPKSTLRVELLAHAAVVHLTSPACKKMPCDGNWTLPVSAADLAVDASLRATVTFTGPVRCWSVVPGAVTDSWWEVFFDLADVNATGFSYAFAARLDGASLVEVNRTTLGAGNWTVDPAHSEGGYIDAGVDLVLDDAASRASVRVPDVENWVDYAYVRASTDMTVDGAARRATFAGLVRVPAPAR